MKEKTIQIIERGQTLIALSSEGRMAEEKLNEGTLEWAEIQPIDWEKLRKGYGNTKPTNDLLARMKNPILLEETETDQVWGEAFGESTDIPERCNKTYDEAKKQCEAMGLELMDERLYRILQDKKKVDIKGWVWLATDKETRESGNAVYGRRGEGGVYVCGCDADYRYPRDGWRASLRVKKS